MNDETGLQVICGICGEERKKEELIPGELVRPSLAALIRKDHPDWDPAEPICYADLDTYRNRYIQMILEQDKGELSDLEKEVAESIRQHDIVSENLNEEFDETMTVGDKIADKVASFGGSWRFIILFGVVLFSWLLLNSGMLLKHPYDPFPFILLNLVLSCIAAIQAPVIMMSQNRQGAKDRLQAEHDYRVNLKAELEIHNLNSKMDQLLAHQWQRLLEIQQIQMEMMEELVQVSKTKQSSQ